MRTGTLRSSRGRVAAAVACLLVAPGCGSKDSEEGPGGGGNRSPVADAGDDRVVPQSSEVMLDDLGSGEPLLLDGGRDLHQAPLV